MTCRISSADSSAGAARAQPTASEYPLQTIPRIFAEAFMVASEFTMAPDAYKCTPRSTTIVALPRDFI